MASSDIPKLGLVTEQSLVQHGISPKKWHSSCVSKYEKKTVVDGIRFVEFGVGFAIDSPRVIQINCVSVVARTIEVAIRSINDMIRSNPSYFCLLRRLTTKPISNLK
jgi:hypothetical protein